MSKPEADRGGQPESRRGVLVKATALVCGGLAVLTPVAAGLWAFLDPLRRGAGVARFLRITDLASLPDDGVPRQFAVLTDRVDAWTGFAAEPVGAVYLRREPGAREVRALSATCPHAGCFVELADDATCFRCPCHDSVFTLDGGIVQPSPSPRPMDRLDCRVAGDTAVEVRWQKFRAGVASQVAQR